MKLLDLYYLVKPAIPHHLRLALRGRIAARKRARSAAVWPIYPDAGRPPAGWAGWPDGKRFAFVLTHDVEGPRGVERCMDLARLEIELGFRSSFNFVPEGTYRASQSLRTTLAQEGFEIGVHDLHHDGTLYRSQSQFEAAARKINQYLAEWNAAGFRSAFMFHNLDWLKQLNVEYDASTFDTDPFEPQSDGVHTIFPFWVHRADGSRYVELPYSLPQDSTLFLVLGEKTNDIWKQKLDWVVEHSGMALVNVHPDYTTFDGVASRSEFPVELYADLLQYVKQKYENECWFALPREIAYFMAGTVQPGAVRDSKAMGATR